MMCSTLFSLRELLGDRGMQEPVESHNGLNTEMIPAERRSRIVDMLQARRAVRVSMLSELLGVSEMTIRRDLERLEAEGVLSRTHGGAILKRHLTTEPVYVESVLAHADEKRRIAQAAAAMIEPGDTVFLNSGTTVVEILRHLDPQLEARIVTNNAGCLAEAAGLAIELVMVGGVYRPSSNAFEGAMSAEHVSDFYASKMLLGADAMSLEEGLTASSVGLALVERAMVRQTRGEVVVLADSSKIGVVANVSICPLDRTQAVIVDDGIDEEMREELERLGLRVQVV
jgi:DeoR family transcriptional regulator, fructose operon transcriptional repressor